MTGRVWDVHLAATTDWNVVAETRDEAVGIAQQKARRAENVFWAVVEVHEDNGDQR